MPRRIAKDKGSNAEDRETPRLWQWGVNQLLFTIEEAGRILALSRREIENLIRAGHLESGIAPGTTRARRISRWQLERYVRKLEEGARW